MQQHDIQGSSAAESSSAGCIKRYQPPKPDIMGMVEMKTDEPPRGGIVGSVELADCLSHSDSPWYTGDTALVLRNPQPLSFTPCPGRLGFFEIEGVAHG
ncbi:hypothetical protein [Pseudomonas abyssi]|uniref:Uncharacterized protein n=1 Tax=Pseudomonas abyssi TaxID=170540 RepID=A0A395R2R0_9PSED|nr:hypothetical protein [Halopseudomonas gallaeciensis]RGP54391.1 hypothetical protein ASB58_10945 [Halopseudomonas gallaeciensis]